MLQILFPITYDCNLKCPFCVAKKATVDITKALQDIKELDGEWVYITGGEPLLSNDLVDVCKELKNMGKKVGVTTNGTIDRYDFLQYVDRLGVSIDGNKEQHDQSRGIGTFDKAISYIKTAKEMVKEIIIMSVIWSGNLDQVPFLINLKNETAVNKLQLQRDVSDSKISIPIMSDSDVVIINKYDDLIKIVDGYSVEYGKTNSNELLSGSVIQNIKIKVDYITVTAPPIHVIPVSPIYNKKTKGVIGTHIREMNYNRMRY